MGLENISFNEYNLYKEIQLNLENYGWDLDSFNKLTGEVLNKYALFTEEAIARGFIEYVLRLKSQESYL